MKKTIIIILLGVLSLFSAYAQNSNYILSDIVYDIKGSTKPFFLEQRLDFGVGQTFETLEEIDAFTVQLAQDLENLRVFEELNVESEVIDQTVILHVTLDDAWGIIPFGYPKYSSDDGGRIAMKLFWYNSLGTLTNSLFQAGINIGLNSVTDKLEIQTWDAQFSIEDIYLFDRFYNISFKQSKERESKDDEEWSFLQSKVSLGTSFDIFGDYTYSPSVSAIAQYNYNVVEHSMDSEDNIDKAPLTLSYDHGISESNINWNGNFRDGYSYGISNTLSLELDSNSNVTPNSTFTVSGKYLKSFGDLPFSFGTKATTIVSINSEMLGLGSNVRGVTSGDMYGYFGIFSNNNIFISVIKIDHFAEAIFSPHFDIGITDKSDLRYGAGGDFILYVNKLKSLVARGSISVDLTEYDLSSPTEGLSIDITSSLFF